MSNPTSNRSPALQAQKPTWQNPKLYILLLMVLYLLIICYVLYYPTRIGAADNGDYERYAGHSGIYGVESFTDDPYPYFYTVYDSWRWEPFEWEMLSPFYPQLSLVYPVSLIRLTTNIFGDTAVNPYQLWYLSLVCVPLLLTALFLLIRFAFQALKLNAIWLSVLGAIFLLGSIHLCYLHSFYGESMVYLWFLMLLGLASNAIVTQRGSAQGKTLSIFTVVAVYMFLTSKAQTVLSYPIWAVLSLWLVAHHWLGREQKQDVRNRVIRTSILLVSVACLLVTGAACYKLYQWNNHLNDRYTVFNSLFTGLLPIADDPMEMLDELGLDRSLARDIGKSAYDPDLLVYPGSLEAEEMIFTKIDTFDLLKYYITHPKYLYTALQISARDSAEYYTKYFLEPYKNAENPDEKSFRITSKFPLWETIRPFIVPKHFIVYALIYASLFSACIVSLIRHRNKPRRRLLIMLFMGMMLTGLIQFPLPFIGNGLADPYKQLYLFMLSFDLTILVSIGWIFLSIRNYYQNANPKKDASYEHLEEVINRLSEKLHTK